MLWCSYHQWYLKTEKTHACIMLERCVHKKFPEKNPKSIKKTIKHNPNIQIKLLLIF